MCLASTLAGLEEEGEEHTGKWEDGKQVGRSDRSDNYAQTSVGSYKWWGYFFICPDV